MYIRAAIQSHTCSLRPLAWIDGCFILVNLFILTATQRGVAEVSVLFFIKKRLQLEKSC